MAEKIFVNIAEYKVTKSPNILAGSGIGSCILICLYESESKIGGMAHSMLPNGQNYTAGNSAKFVNVGIDLLLKGMIRGGAKKSTIEAKMVGGAKMFPSISNPPGGDIGQRNAQSAREKLEKEGITLVTEDTGGNHGRSIEFDVSNGIVTVRIKL